MKETLLAGWITAKCKVIGTDSSGWIRIKMWLTSEDECSSWRPKAWENSCCCSERILCTLLLSCSSSPSILWRIRLSDETEWTEKIWLTQTTFTLKISPKFLFSNLSHESSSDVYKCLCYTKYQNFNVYTFYFLVFLNFNLLYLSYYY